MPQPSLPLGHTVEGNKLVALDGFNFERHKHIIGISGSGKSSFIAAIVVLLLRQGISFCLIDPHGDLAKLIISLLTGSDFYNNPRAYDRLWYVDLNRQDAAIAWNVLKQDHIDNYKVASNLVEAIHRAWPSSSATTALDNTIEYSAFVLAECGVPLTQLQRFLLDSSFRDALLAKIKDRQIVQFFDFKFSDKVSSQLIDSTMRRLDLLTFSPGLRAALGQRQNKLNFRYLMDMNISCIMNLGGLSDAEKRLAGCLITVGLEQAFLSRATMPVEKRTPYHVIIDEFPLFTVSDNSFSVILEQVRKYGGTLYLAHQTTSQLSNGMTGSLQNAISILFKLGYEDSTWAAQRFVRKQDEQGSSLIDWVLHGGRSESSPFDETKNTQEAKQIFESLARQEAIITLNNLPFRIRTLTIPSVKVDAKRLKEIEDTYARKLLTPLSQIEREQTASHLVVVSSAPRLARRVLVPSTNAVKPFTLSTGDFDTDILSCLYHFHYCVLAHLSALLGKKKSENYLRDKKLKQLIDSGLIETTTLARQTAGRPATVYYLSASGLKQITDTLDLPVLMQPGARKHLFLEHSLDCTDAVVAAFALHHVENAITVFDLKHEQTFKASPLQVGSHRYLVPDGFIRIHAIKPFGVGDELGILLEIDRNSEGREKWQQKIEAYKLISPDTFDGLSSITIAIVVTSGGVDRRNTLVEWSREVLKNHAIKDLLVFSAHETITPQLYLSPEFVTIDNLPCALVEKGS